MSFTEAELEYLAGQRLGRLATRAPAGDLQNNPVGFRYNPQTRTIDVSGHNLAASRKYRNVQANGEVAFVVDDLVSTDPWRVRGVEVRGTAEALSGLAPDHFGSTDLIRIHPRRIFSWGVDSAHPRMYRHDVE